jgi:hypothetical protein
MLGLLAPKERDASKMLAQKTKRGEFFMLGMGSSSKLQAFLASDKHCIRLLLKGMRLFGLS